MAAALMPKTTSPGEQLDDLNATVEQFEAPGHPFDPISAPRDAIDRVGFPPRPDEDTQPGLYAIWKDVFTRGLAYERAHFALAYPGAYYDGSTGAALRRSHREASRNWSGAYLAPRNGEMITQVVGRWTVPTVQPAPDGGFLDPYGSSTWIGLDGQRAYFHSTLPQIGTGQLLSLLDDDPVNPTIVPGSKTEAWVQWWPLCPVTLAMEVLPGDLMAAWLIVRSETEVHFVIVNVSRLTYTPFTLPAPEVKMPPRVPNPVQATVSGATAEWIMERPAICGSPDPMTLPHFESVTFDACLAVTARSPTATVGHLRAQTSPKLIRMYSVEEAPHRTVTRATAARPTSPGPPFTQIVVTYKS
jgi:hypothetical protein